jgi:plasmid rolling circle replication initiator protein Rep
MWTARFHKALPSILSDYPTAKFLFLTLTVKNCELDDLRKTIALMNEAWNRMTLRKFFPAKGYVKSIEVTKGQDGLAHPHIHALLMVPSSYFTFGYIKQADWTEYWRKALRVDYTPIVNIKSVQKPRSLNGDLTKQLMNAVKETLKYSVKPQDLVSDPEWLDGITQALHKTRSVSLGGIFRQYLSEDEPEDLINTDTDTEKDELLLDEDILLFDWAELVRKYRKKDSSL